MYAPLLRAGRSGFAWEWLRRDLAYVEASRAARQGGRRETTVADPRAARWGLHAFEAPDRPVPAARPVWRREFFPYVLQAEADDAGGAAERLDLERLGALATPVIDGGGCEHLLLSDGQRSIRIDILSGTLRAGPVRLRYRLSGLAGVEPPLLALRQLLALWRTGTFSAALHPSERRAARWILALRAHDALAAGCSQREIALRLLGSEAAGPRWRIEASSLRSRAQRLVREARRQAAGGYLSLVGGR